MSKIESILVVWISLLSSAVALEFSFLAGMDSYNLRNLIFDPKQHYACVVSYLEPRLRIFVIKHNFCSFYPAQPSRPQSSIFLKFFRLF